MASRTEYSLSEQVVQTGKVALEFQKYTLQTA